MLLISLYANLLDVIFFSIIISRIHRHKPVLKKNIRLKKNHNQEENEKVLFYNKNKGQVNKICSNKYDNDESFKLDYFLE